MKKTIFITILIIAAGLYIQNSGDEDIQEPQQKSLQPAEQKPQKIKEAPPQTAKVKKKVLKLVPQQSTSPNAKYPNLGDDFVPFDEEGNRYITQIIRDGRHLLYHGDVLVGDAKDLAKIQKRGFIKSPPPQRWPGGKIPYIIDEDLKNYEKIMEAIEYVNQSTHAQFIPREEENNYIHITLGDSDCYSYVGMMGGMQEIFLAPNCGVREVVHEITHTLGFFHEQNREDRDQHLDVLWENIDESHHTQFKKIPNDFLGVRNRPFDFNSLMMYSSFVFSAVQGEPALVTKDGSLIPRSRNLYSEEDINRINAAYPEN